MSDKNNTNLLTEILWHLAAMAFWHKKPKRRWYFGKSVFSSGIFGTLDGIVANLSKLKEKKHNSRRRFLEKGMSNSAVNSHSDDVVKFCCNSGLARILKQI